MNNAPTSGRIAILGVRGIGLTHARILNELGVNICAVLGSTDATARAAAAEVEKVIGYQPMPCCDIERLLDQTPDGVSICTPAHMHFKQVLACFESGVPVFCEKPLFWDDRLNASELRSQLSVLVNHPFNNLQVNTSNALFIDAVQSQLPAAADVERFLFRFHTNGVHRGHAIGADLIPHGLSLLIRLLGTHAATDFSATWSDNQYRCEFMYGNRPVVFDFQQSSVLPKDLMFSVNDVEFKRVQIGQGGTYQVRLQNTATKEQIPVEDPFRTYLSTFVNRCKSKAEFPHEQFAESVLNLQLMFQFLAQ